MAWDMIFFTALSNKRLFGIGCSLWFIFIKIRQSDGLVFYNGNSYTRKIVLNLQTGPWWQRSLVDQHHCTSSLRYNTLGFKTILHTVGLLNIQNDILYGLDMRRVWCVSWKEKWLYHQGATLHEESVLQCSLHISQYFFSTTHKRHHIAHRMEKVWCLFLWIHSPNKALVFFLSYCDQ